MIGAVPKRARLSRNVLAGGFPAALHEEAAWDLMTAVQALYPERFAKLRSLQSVPDLADKRRGAQDWAAANNISCPAVSWVAELIAGGQEEPGESFSITIYADQHGQLIPEPEPIQARPKDQTLEEFLDRARRHYRDVREWLVARGESRRPIKHERDHFGYLAAHLIGDHSWAQIARGETGLNLPKMSQKTVAGEARKAAALVGLLLSPQRGPRPGSKVPRRRRRPRRP